MNTYEIMAIVAATVVAIYYIVVFFKMELKKLEYKSDLYFGGGELIGSDFIVFPVEDYWEAAKKLNIGEREEYVANSILWMLGERDLNSDIIFMANVYGTFFIHRPILNYITNDQYDNLFYKFDGLSEYTLDEKKVYDYFTDLLIKIDILSKKGGE